MSAYPMTVELPNPTDPDALDSDAAATVMAWLTLANGVGIEAMVTGVLIGRFIHEHPDDPFVATLAPVLGAIRDIKNEAAVDALTDALDRWASS